MQALGSRSRSRAFFVQFTADIADSAIDDTRTVATALLRGRPYLDVHLVRGVIVDERHHVT